MSDLLKVDPYEYFLRAEPALNKTPVAVDDRGLRYTYRDIAVTRNARPDQKREMQVFLDPMPHVILDQNIPLRGWYKAKHEPSNVRPRPCYTEALLTQPYGGFCHVGCGFCYINNGTRGYRGQGVTTVDPHYPYKIGRQLDRMKIGSAVYLSSFTDPFLPLEELYHNTQRTAQAAIDRGLPIFFLTRLQVPGWAYDQLKRNPHSYLQFSINTPREHDWRKLSPRALPLPAMFDQVREAHRQGIYLSIQVNPIMSGITSVDDICDLIEILAGCGANHLIFKHVEVTYSAAPHLVTNMTRRFGESRGNQFRSLLTQNIGGMRTIDEEYRKNALDRYAAVCAKANVTMSLCYEYEYGANKTGISLGPKYTTSAQCHGHRVPVYVRRGDRFEPLAVCPDGGCLTCASVNEKPPCGDTRLFLAPALGARDLNEYEGT